MEAKYAHLAFWSAGTVSIPVLPVWNLSRAYSFPGVQAAHSGEPAAR